MRYSVIPIFASPLADVTNTSRFCLVAIIGVAAKIGELQLKTSVALKVRVCSRKQRSAAGNVGFAAINLFLRLQKREKIF